MSYTQSFGYMMATCSSISLFCIFLYFITLCRNKQLRTTQSLFISGLFTCDICNVIGAFLLFGVSSASKSPSVCIAGFVIFNCAIVASFILSTGLVVSVLTLTGLVPKSLQESRSAKVAGVLGMLGLIFTYGGIVTYLDVRNGVDEYCSHTQEGNVMTWVLWGLTSSFNLCSLVFVFLQLRKVMSFTEEHKNRTHMRIVATIALMVGCLRIPSFIIGMVSGGEVANILTPDVSIGVVIGIFIAYALTVLQGAFVVICVTFNQRTACFSYLKTTTTSYTGGSEPASSSGGNIAGSSTGKPRVSMSGDRKDSRAHEHLELELELREA